MTDEEEDIVAVRIHDGKEEAKLNAEIARLEAEVARERADCIQFGTECADLRKAFVSDGERIERLSQQVEDIQEALTEETAAKAEAQLERDNAVTMVEAAMELVKEARVERDEARVAAEKLRDELAWAEGVALCEEVPKKLLAWESDAKETP